MTYLNWTPALYPGLASSQPCLPTPCQVTAYLLVFTHHLLRSCWLFSFSSSCHQNHLPILCSDALGTLFPLLVSTTTSAWIQASIGIHLQCFTLARMAWTLCQICACRSRALPSWWAHKASGSVPPPTSLTTPLFAQYASAVLSFHFCSILLSTELSNISFI